MAGKDNDEGKDVFETALRKKQRQLSSDDSRDLTLGTLAGMALGAGLAAKKAGKGSKTMAGLIGGWVGGHAGQFGVALRNDLRRKKK
jgi:outer membrane lipoprotein SlyB